MGPETRRVAAWRRCASLAAITTALLTLALVPGSALGATTFVSQFGTFGTGPAQFHGPVGVTISPLNGDVYVTDYENNRVERWTTSGSFVSSFGTGGSGNGQFDQPYHVAIDAAGDVYVADFGNNRVQKFDASGTWLATFGGFGTGPGQFRGPTGIALSPANNELYVSDRDNHRVQRWSTSGAFLGDFGTNGSGNGQFNQPFGIGINAAGDVYVADIGNFRVQRFTAAGTYVTQWGSNGAGNGQFARPNGVTIGSTGHVYVTDVFNDRVEEFDANGTYLDQFGVAGAGPGDFDLTFGAWATPAGDVYVTDYNNNRVQRFQDIEPPLNTVAPAITGPAYEGKTLTGSTGTWEGTAPVTYVYEWLRCDSGGGSCVPATAASNTLSPYTIVGADIGGTLRLRVTASNAAGPVVAQSAATAIVNNYAGVVSGDAPYAYWRLGDPLNSFVMADSSGHGFDGEYKNGASGSPQIGISGDGDTVGWFAGNGTYGYVNNMPAPAGYHVSVEAWIKPSDLGPASIFHHGGAAALFITDGQQLAFRPEDNRPDSELDASIAGLDLNQFHHVAATWDGRTARLYLDGAEIASGIRRGHIGPSMATAYVGYGFLAPWFRGMLDEVAYYSTVLTPAQVLTHYTADPPPPSPASRSAVGPVPKATAKAKAKPKAKKQPHRSPKKKPKKKHKKRQHPVQHHRH